MTTADQIRNGIIGELLKLSEKDIEDQNFIPQAELDKADLKWLKEKTR